MLLEEILSNKYSDRIMDMQGQRSVSTNFAIVNSFVKLIMNHLCSSLRGLNFSYLRSSH
jgi:hypothetical protein